MSKLSPLENYRSKIGEKAGFYIGKDDPIICLYEFLDLFVEDFHSQIKSINSEQEVTNKLLMEEWQKTSKTFAQNVLSAALSNSKQHAEKIFGEASSAFKSELNTIIQQEHQKRMEKQESLRLMLVYNIILFILSAGSLVVSILLSSFFRA